MLFLWTRCHFSFFPRESWGRDTLILPLYHLKWQGTEVYIHCDNLLWYTKKSIRGTNGKGMDIVAFASGGEPKKEKAHLSWDLGEKWAILPLRCRNKCRMRRVVSYLGCKVNWLGLSLRTWASFIYSKEGNSGSCWAALANDECSPTSAGLLCLIL